MKFDASALVRQNIRELRPYSSARSEFKGSAEIFLDANENAFGSPAGMGLNRYPDPLQKAVKERISSIKGVSSDRIFLGNGSDEAIDLLFRVFCWPGVDEVIICPPTYGMYRVYADINDVDVVEVLLTQSFDLDVSGIKDAIDPDTKLIFVCSPNNPTGNLMKRGDIVDLLKSFGGIVVVDEAYIDFAGREASLLPLLDSFPNLVVLQTFSKAWGMAGLRVGMAFADPAIIGYLNRVKPPYNISGLAQAEVLKALGDQRQVEQWIQLAAEQRGALERELNDLNIVHQVHASDANFLLVRVEDARALYRRLIEEGIVVRDRSNVFLCEGCLRITVGTPDENKRLVEALSKFDEQNAASAETNK